MESESQTLAKAEPHQPRNAIRSIKVALLLSRLKAPSSSAAAAAAELRDSATEKELKRVIGDLKMEVVKERLRSKRIRLSGLMETFLEVAMVFLLSSVLFAIAVGN